MTPDDIRTVIQAMKGSQEELSRACYWLAELARACHVDGFRIDVRSDWRVTVECVSRQRSVLIDADVHVEPGPLPSPGNAVPLAVHGVKGHERGERWNDKEGADV